MNRKYRCGGNHSIIGAVVLSLTCKSVLSVLDRRLPRHQPTDFIRTLQAFYRKCNCRDTKITDLAPEFLMRINPRGVQHAMAAESAIWRADTVDAFIKNLPKGDTFLEMFLLLLITRA